MYYFRHFALNIDVIELKKNIENVDTPRIFTIRRFNNFF